jgi:hypothetical protein
MKRKQIHSPGLKAVVLAAVVTFLIFVTLFISDWLTAQNTGQLETKEKVQWSGSQISPLHRIPLMDEFNQKIIPTAPQALPFSTRYSCAPCHSYETISKGTHFNFREPPKIDRLTEPWFLMDEKVGIQIPVSFQSYPGFWSPEKLGITGWQFVNLFGRNLNGGGPGEPAENELTSDSRWNVSGYLEINCLGCHNRSLLQDHSEWVKQVMRQNFRWAATAASGVGEVSGMASRLPSTWDLYDGPNPDDHEWAIVPEVKYNLNLFDGKNNVVLDLPHQPDDARCLACHSITPRKEKTKAALDGDVHSTSGLKCVDCHRNDISHQMIRGFEGEKLSNSSLQAEDFTCAGCHLGKNPEKGGQGFTGRLGAPRPAHRGFPKVHFERLACTVCHSGLLPEKKPERVFTSRANRLGVFGKALWTSDYPLIIEPVYVREKDKKIYPERMMWPAFWAERKGEEFVPLDGQVVLTLAPEIFQVKEKVSALISGLQPLAEGEFSPAVVISEFLYLPNVDGSLDALKQEKLKKADKNSFSLVQTKGEKIKSLLPAFDPEKAEPEIEDKILKVLEGLKVAANDREPVFVVSKVVYRINEGVLEKAKKPGEPARFPEIGWLKGEKIEKLLSDFEVRTLGLLGDGVETLTEEQVALVLKKLSEINPQKEFVYLASGRMFSLDSKGNLRAADHHLAHPVSWPLAHNVRPAQQALGKNGCTDCHSPASKVFFAKVEAESPLKTEMKESKLRTDFMRTGSLFQLIFGFTFWVRPVFKLALAACVLIIGLLLVLVLAKVLGQASGITEGKDKQESRR